MKTTEISCLCGTVKVQLTGHPITQFYCHCDDCQATSGGAYIGVAVYPVDAVKIMQGELTTWTLKSLPRQRCAVCGTHVMAEVPGLAQVGIKANLLPKGEFKPDFHLHCRYAVLPVKDDLPHFKDLPASFGGTDGTSNW
ncbi:Glutathione-dependent formaldehyde-activating enzyme [Halomicronema hongdechloris C2206]|uniref:Glutathione-dependent formaldehyde-activating enzyme n=1 Tax=Halomicronema hongdechloris C2206 TaxID=1641165 RepID=A0A1Z3HNT1_9CYAN|nr:GFA family protein [Halomicronema hongdechloris]ASC71930.1 Glutathione-dependent formaldehyde-activating enzyme [Halomicronema hongdechloris C2206]